MYKKLVRRHKEAGVLVVDERSENPVTGLKPGAASFHSSRGTYRAAQARAKLLASTIHHYLGG